MKNETKTLIAIIALIIAVILIINHIKGNSNGDINEEAIQCIAKNSKLVASKTCTHCITQLNILKDYQDHFNIVYIDEDPSILNKYNLQGVPSWIINEKVYEGVRTLEQLKEITKC